MKRTDRPRSRRSLMRSTTRAARSAGSAAVISSSTSSWGSCTSARVRSRTRSTGRGTSLTIAPTSRSRTPIRSRPSRTGPGSMPVRRRFCSMVRSGISAGSWNTVATPAARASEGRRRRAGFPSTSTDPASAWITPARILTKVLLPAPFAPSNACISPGWTVRSAERSATMLPYRFARPRTSRSGGLSLTNAPRLSAEVGRSNRRPTSARRRSARYSPGPLQSKTSCSV